MCNLEDIVITKDDLREALKAKFEREPTKQELKKFREFCIVDIGDWLRDNAKNFE